jgi:hypothetical protein
MNAADVGQEDKLLAHIREKLLDYALTYLTKNYITFTQDAVAHVRFTFARSRSWLLKCMSIVALRIPSPDSKYRIELADTPC